MAGIGFSLKKLFQKKGVFNLCRAYGYAGLICAGPMILGVVLLVSIAFLSQLAGMSRHDRELLNCMLTYCLLASLTTTSIFNMTVTRYVSDMLYEEKPERIMPSFYGSIGIMLVGGCLLWGVFLHFSGVRILYRLLCLWFYAILIVTWMEMNFLTALKDYKALVVDFAVSLGLGLFLALLLVLFRQVNIATLFLCVILAYGLLMALYFRQLLKYFPESEGSKFSFLRWFDKYRSLAFTGMFVNLGLFAHLVIMYFGPLRVQVEGLFYGAPMHDVPALCAFFSILITTVNFVTSVEVRFYPQYRNYYSLFNDNGSIMDIKQAENEMISVLRQELAFNAHKQLIATLLFIVIGSIVLETLPLGFNDTSMGIYRLLCAGYRPILAHAVRYDCLYRQLSRAKELTLIGCFLQVNSQSVTGAGGWTVKRMTNALLKEGIVHFVATDAHRAQGRRSVHLQKCAAFLERKYGRPCAEALLFRNARALLENREIEEI